MIRSADFLTLTLQVLAVCGTAYYALCLWAALDFAALLRKRARSGAFLPPVSLLKPLSGTDPGGVENLRSHCLQEYPRYEVLFAVRDPADPAAAAVRKVLEEFPGSNVRLLVCPQILGTNLKVSTLVQLLPHARYAYLVVSDGDIRVEPSHLRQVMAPLEDARVGLVTCLYRSVPGRGLPSALEAVGTSSTFAAGVLAARRVEGGIHFALGSTLAFPRRTLEAIGGLEPLLDYLADDFELGYRTAAAGLRVELASAVVSHHLPDYTFREFWRHQLRWNRSTRASRPKGYAGMVLTFGLPWAILGLAAAPASAFSWAVAAAAAALRLTSAFVVSRFVLSDAWSVRHLPLVPLYDLIGLLLWIGGLQGRRVSWRGSEFYLEEGRLRPAQPV